LTAGPAAAAGHGKKIAIQGAAQPGINYRLKVSGNEGVNPNAVTREHVQHRARDRPTDQRVGPQFGQAQGFLDGGFTHQDLFGFSDDPAGRGVYQADEAGHVKNRSNPIVPC
jgi:hypothetical protein